MNKPATNSDGEIPIVELREDKARPSKNQLKEKFSNLFDKNSYLRPINNIFDDTKNSLFKNDDGIVDKFNKNQNNTQFEAFVNSSILNIKNILGGIKINHAIFNNPVIKKDEIESILRVSIEDKEQLVSSMRNNLIDLDIICNMNDALRCILNTPLDNANINKSSFLHLLKGCEKQINDIKEINMKKKELKNLQGVIKKKIDALRLSREDSENNYSEEEKSLLEDLKNIIYEDNDIELGILDFLKEEEIYSDLKKT